MISPSSASAVPGEDSSGRVPVPASGARRVRTVWRGCLATALLLAFSVILPDSAIAQLEEFEDGRCYELRTYTAPEGELDDLDRRFRKYSRTVFARYGMARLGFWIPTDNPENHFTYILSYPNCDYRDPSWDRFLSDSLWNRVERITTHDGELVSNVENRIMTPTDFSPVIGPSAREHERVFELRTYTAAPGKRDELLDRFEDHTMEIFRRHGMENVAYWLPRDSDRELVYMLAFPSRYARDEAWREFDMDPEWQRVYEASRQDGPLVENVESVMLEPTDYSPLR